MDRATFYANQADRMTWERDPIIAPSGTRLDTPSGRRTLGMARWMRFNDPSQLLWIDLPDGRTVALTRPQEKVRWAVYRMAGSRQRTTMRHLGEILGLAPSTISRTLVKLASFGLIAYQSNRGRNGGTVFILRVKGDWLDWFQQEAKARVRAWRKAAEARVSRLRRNVASSHPDRERELYPTNHDRAQQMVKPGWTVEELREAGIL